MNAIVIRNLRKGFGDRELFKGVSFKFQSKGVYGIIGDSGCGKSSLLDIIYGIDDSFEGDVEIYGQSLSIMSEEEKCAYRHNEFGFLNQSSDLLEDESVSFNISLPMLAKGIKKKDIKRKVRDLLELVSLGGKEKQKASKLSGGEKQRVALARSLALDPKIILADEPTGALDEKNSEMIFEILSSLGKDRLVIIVTHDEDKARTHCNHILRLEEGLLTEETRNEEIESKRNIVYLPNKEKGKRFPLKAWFTHAINILKEKRNRTFILLSVITFSLTALGISSYVSKSLGNELESSFSSLSGIDGVVMEMARDDKASISRSYSASKDRASSFVESLSDDILGQGSRFFMNYESFFTDSNSFSYDSKGRKCSLPSLGVRSINEYRWLELEDSASFYPEKPTILEDEEIVLGLPYESMARLCLDLGILRSYESLGSYLFDNPLELTLETSNEIYGYSDSHLFSLVAIKEESTPLIYHSRRDWNSLILQSWMGFPSNLGEENDIPWMMQEVPFIISKTSVETLWNDLRKSGYADIFLFEKDEYMGFNNEYLIYEVDRDSLSYGDSSLIVDRYKVSDYMILGENTYRCYPKAMSNGFAYPFFISNKQNSLEVISDSVSRMKSSTGYAGIETDDDILMGYYLKPQNSSLTLSSDFSKLSSGRKPKKINEVCISKSIADKFSNPNSLFCAGVRNASMDGEYTLLEYGFNSLEVVGIADSPNYVIYALPTFSIDYFREYLGVSSFLLEPRKAILYMSKSKAEKYIPDMENRYAKYSFISPSLEISDSISSVVDYMGLLLTISSLATISISAILFLVSAISIATERKKEGKLLYRLGASKSDISNSFSMPVLIISGVSLLASFIGTLSSEALLSKTISESFGTTSSKMTFDISPLPLIMICHLIGLCISLCFVYLNVKRSRLNTRD